jgi:hypothetical protein
MRIGTWNVWHAYENRLPAIKEVLDAHPAHLWVFTETHDDLAPANCKNVAKSTERPKLSFNIRDGSRWVSIWSAFDGEQVFVEGGDNERTAIALLNLGSGRQMVVYGTVLPWEGDRRIPGWTEFLRVVPQQCEEWRKLRQRYPDAALCIAGDYNTDMIGQLGQYGGTGPGVDSIKSCFAECGLFWATTPERIAGKLAKDPIDHIALPRAWQERTTVVDAWPANKPLHSDHSGLVVLVEDWRNEELER